MTRCGRRSPSRNIGVDALDELADRPPLRGDGDLRSDRSLRDQAYACMAELVGMEKFTGIQWLATSPDEKPLRMYLGALRQFGSAG